MSSSDKLTKKQKKALAFRARKGTGKAKDLDSDGMANDVPVAEDQDLAEIGGLDGQEDGEEGGRKLEEVVRKAGKKRKREDEVGVGEGGGDKAELDAKRKQKKRKAVDEDQGGDDQDAQKQEAGSSVKRSKADVKQRFILFVGNLKYVTSKEAVQKHFSSCDPPPDVRLMTPKPSANARLTAKSKGFAFLEFPSKAGLQQALKLHHSDLEGRKINVELTAGGGGKSDNRIAKVKERNKELHNQRVKRVQKLKGSKEGADKDVLLDRPQRYSATSGIGEVPTAKRTWTVGDTTEKPAKKRGSKKNHVPRPQGTGVNAIPVG